MPKTKFTTLTAPIDSCVSDALDQLRDELGGEMRDWHDNMPESLQGGDKGSQVDEAASTLECLIDIDVPEFLGAMECTYSEMSKRTKSGSMPRWMRRDNACAMLEAVRSMVEDLIGEWETLISDLPADAEDDTEINIGTNEMPDVSITKSELETRIEETKEFAEEVERVKDEAESVEFPGMFG